MRVAGALDRIGVERRDPVRAPMPCAASRRGDVHAHSRSTSVNTLPVPVPVPAAGQEVANASPARATPARSMPGRHIKIGGFQCAQSPTVALNAVFCDLVQSAPHAGFSCNCNQITAKDACKPLCRCKVTAQPSRGCSPPCP
jgi:hypothetical protein